MQSTDITAKVKNYIRFGLIVVISLAAAIGYGEYKYWHKDDVIQIEDAKIAGTMVSVRVLANGKVSELLFEDGAEVTIESLMDCGLVSNPRDGVKILGNGEITKKLTVKATKFTESAKEKIEAAGGKVEVF